MSTRKKAIDEKGYQSQSLSTTNWFPRKKKWHLRVHPSRSEERGNRISCPQVPMRSRDVPQQESLNGLQSGAAPAKEIEGAAHKQCTRAAERKTIRKNWRTRAPPNPIIDSLKDKIEAEEENPTNKKKSEMEENHEEPK